MCLQHPAPGSTAFASYCFVKSAQRAAFAPSLSSGIPRPPTPHADPMDVHFLQQSEDY